MKTHFGTFHLLSKQTNPSKATFEGTKLRIDLGKLRNSDSKDLNNAITIVNSNETDDVLLCLNQRKENLKNRALGIQPPPDKVVPPLMRSMSPETFNNLPKILLESFPKIYYEKLPNDYHQATYTATGIPEQIELTDAEISPEQFAKLPQAFLSLLPLEFYEKLPKRYFTPDLQVEQHRLYDAVDQAPIEWSPDGLKLFVERPCIPLVLKLHEMGKKPYSSNAFGYGPKGVYWQDPVADNQVKFSPLNPEFKEKKVPPTRVGLEPVPVIKIPE